MTVLIITEKPSQGRAFGKALGATPGKVGSFDGEDFVIVSARGHLYELAKPEEQVSGDLVAKYGNWNLDHLPWNPQEMKFKHVPMKGASGELQKIKQAAAKATEIAIGTDVDPSGEGGMIAGNIILELGLDSKKLTRMYFTDEAVSSVQKAFRERKPIQSIQHFDEYRKASYRSKWDFLSMQFSRVATVSAAQKGILRQGRLKSAMLLLVGDQLKAYNEYVRKPFFENRFRDDHGVMYTNPDEPRFGSEAEVDASMYAASKVILDSRQNKNTKPPRLLDLATLSSRLSGKSYRADDVLKTYQKMYEGGGSDKGGIVSYPRTEDKHITTEQFKEMLPLVDKIATVVGVDTNILTERAPRKTHVKDHGAHGANRPGLTVPQSLSAVEKSYGKLGRLIYEEVARSFLAMFAENYVYEYQEGHLEDYPKFVGSASVPKVMGWKEVFFADQDDDEDDDTTQGLGSTAEPFIHEGQNKRPPHPTMKWLMNQLERRDVGTGATRTSTYAEVTNPKGKFSQMAESRGKITLTEIGDISYRMLPGTKIGDLGITEMVFDTMDKVAAGEASEDEELARVADLVAHDIEVMKTNGEQMRKDLGLTAQAQAKEKATGMWKGQEVTINREWGGVRFTDAQLKSLFADETIEFDAVSGAGNPYTASGKLEKQKFKGHEFVGFKLNTGPKKDKDGNEIVPDAWCNVKFTPQQKQMLADGKGVKSDKFYSKAKKKYFTATVFWKDEKGQKKIVPSFG